MSEQVKFLMKTDYALAVTGNLGPDVLEDKPLGLVHIAVSADGLTVTAELLLKGQREENKAEASREALKLLMQTIKGLQ
jgi:nicotinamide mononucleotide (NMN) deamidase PncC